MGTTPVGIGHIGNIMAFDFGVAGIGLLHAKAKDVARRSNPYPKPY